MHQVFSRVKLQDGPEYFGYRGILTNIKTENGLLAEMQVNSPGMIYAKVFKEEALLVIGEQEYDDIAKKTGLPGGLGHVYYEQIRAINIDTASKQELEKLEKLKKQSEEYYSHFYGF